MDDERYYANKVFEDMHCYGEVFEDYKFEECTFVNCVFEECTFRHFQTVYLISVKSPV